MTPLTGPLRWLLLLAGHACVGIAVAGAFIPLLPSTPFLLLAAACYVRASEKHYTWLIEHPILGRFIKDYREHKAIPREVKGVLLFTLWVSLSVSAWRLKGFQTLWIGALFLVCAAIGTTLILRIKTLPPPPDSPDAEPSVPDADAPRENP